jgi:hypothetical protein
MTKSLLGLGLNFCVQPLYSNKPSKVDFARLRRNAFNRMYLAGNDPLPNTKLFVPSQYKTPDYNVTTEFRVRFNEFERKAALLFQCRRSQPNLLPTQATILHALRSNAHLHVWKTDKNLGPAVIERDEYIRRALVDHLLDNTTYRYLEERMAIGRIKAMTGLAIAFEKKHFPKPKDKQSESATAKSERLFLERSRIAAKDDPFGYFYLMAKIHKQPWSTRPIVSCSGCLYNGLARWVDQELQKIVRQLPYVIRSSADLVRNLVAMDPLPPSARFFTCDATAMYTNICTKHALRVIMAWLDESPIPAQTGVNVPALKDALGLVMSHSVFRFGDTFWTQFTGTIMGTPPAPTYATLYFYIHEEKLIPSVSQLKHYGRLIDDGMGIWIPESPEDDQQWLNFQQQFGSFGKLSWVFSERTTSIDFLDITISLTPAGTVQTRLFEKALNLYLYVPPHSAHPPGCLKGLIAGTFHRIQLLTSDPADRLSQFRRLYDRLRARGYSPSTLKPLFTAAVSPKGRRKRLALDDAPLFLHLQFHPGDPPSQAVQTVFKNTVSNPIGEPRLEQLRNHEGARFPGNRLIIAFHRPRNLGNMLNPRRFDKHGVSVQQIYSKLLEKDPTHDA